MKRLALTLCFCLTLLAFAGAAQAVQFTLGSYSVWLEATNSDAQYVYSDHSDYGLMLYWDPVPSGTGPWELTSGQPFGLFKVGTTEDFVNKHDFDSFGVSVTFNVSSPEFTGTVSVLGLSSGFVDPGGNGYFPTGHGQVQWQDPVYLDLGPNEKLTVELSDVIFPLRLDHNASHDSDQPATVWATLTLVPEPSIMLLLGCGLIGLFVLGKRFRVTHSSCKATTPPSRDWSR